MTSNFIELFKRVGIWVLGLQIALSIVLMVLSVGALILLQPDFDTLVLLTSSIFLLLSAGIYIWGGWKAIRYDFSLSNAAKMGAAIGFIHSAASGLTNFEGLGFFVFAVVLETAFGLIFAVAGGVLATKVRIK